MRLDFGVGQIISEYVVEQLSKPDEITYKGKKELCAVLDICISSMIFRKSREF